MPTEVDTAGFPVNGEDSLAPHYPTFHRAELPTGSSALDAWVGDIGAFADDQSAKLILRALDRDLPVIVDRGLVMPTAEAGALPAHRLEATLAQMSITFRVLVLSFGQGQHPRAYCINPLINLVTCPMQPHLRADQTIEFRNYVLPALCVYSAAEFKYSTELPHIVQFLDQTSIYLAKHLIWLRTRRMFEAETGRLVFAPAPGSVHIVSQRPYTRYVEMPTRGFNRYWSGHWAGSAAPCTTAEHVSGLDPRGQCWCGSGRKYDACHRRIEVASLQQKRSAAKRQVVFS